jgi:aryl-alcohol dehydrogenase-like predicted oxidoreductase
VVYQGSWSAAAAILSAVSWALLKPTAWQLLRSTLGIGYFKTKAQVESTEGRERLFPSPNALVVSQVQEKVAERNGTLIASVAIAYVMHKAPYVFPLCGGRQIEHLETNIEALALELSDEDIKEIEAAVPFDLGVPIAHAWNETGVG